MTSPALQFIDSHAHLDFYKATTKPFDELAALTAQGLRPDTDTRSPTLEEALQRMKESHTRAISIGTQAADWPVIAQIAQENPALVAYTVGLHPGEVKADWREEVKALEKHLSENDPLCCGIGEIGLDYFKMEESAARNGYKNPREFVENQRDAFEAQISIIKSAGLPVVIHSRGEGAYKEIIERLDKNKVEWSKFVFHCFSEGPEEIRELNARGARASFTGIITFKNGQKMRDALIAQTAYLKGATSGLDLLMIETDAPFLSPEPFRGKPNEPARVGLVAQKAAELLGVTLEELAPRIFKNTCEFYGIKGWA